MAKSILQEKNGYCFLCGRYKGSGLDSLDEHHVFGGALRDKSEKYGLKVYLHHLTCHENGKNAVHQSGEVADKLKAYAQRKAMEHYGWSLDEWMQRFYVNYLEESEYEAESEGEFMLDLAIALPY